jgi:hypothetical protein
MPERGDSVLDTLYFTTILVMRVGPDMEEAFSFTERG